MAAESYGVDKENSPAPAKKRARKSSTASKRVSFSDTVSVRHIEKLDASPNASPAMSTRSRRSSLTFSAVVVTSGPAAASAPAAAESHIMEVPSEPVRLQRMPLEPAGLVSPAPSDRSDVFFSPQESASPIVSLSSLLQQDDGFEAAVPRLANLIHQDARQANAEPNHEDVTMEMTIGVGGILAAAASSHGSPAQPVLNTPPPPLEPVQDAPASRYGEASDEDCTMDLTGTYGGIKETAAAIRWPEQTSLISEGVAPAIAAPLVAVPMPTAEPADMPSAALLPSSASDSGLSRRTSSAWHRRSSLGTMLGVLTEEPHEHVEAEAHPPAEEEQPPLPEEEEAVVSSKVGEKRRFSLSDKLQAVSSRLWRFTSAQDPVHEPEAEADHIASGGASAAGATEDVLAEGGPGAAASALATFDEYLDEAGVAVEVLAVPAAERVHKVLALIVDASSGEAFCNRLMTAMVLSPELDQLHWANQELNKCIGMLQDGYARMEDYITENAPSFFTAPEMKIEQAKLEKLSARCRQTARVFWYDWRVTLESDLGTKLLKAQQSLDNDLAHLQQNSAQLRAAGAKIKAARPAARPAASLAALEEEAALLEAQLTQRAATVGRIEVQQSALAEAVRLAEAELVAIRAEHEAKQRELCDHRKHLCAVHEEPASLRIAALGRELLDALQVHRLPVLANAPARARFSCAARRRASHPRAPPRCRLACAGGPPCSPRRASYSASATISSSARRCGQASRVRVPSSQWRCAAWSLCSRQQGLYTNRTLLCCRRSSLACRSVLGRGKGGAGFSCAVHASAPCT